MIANFVFVDVKPENIEDFKKASVLNHEGSRKEPGNVRFDVLNDNKDPNKFILFEVFADTDAAAALCPKRNVTQRHFTAKFLFDALNFNIHSFNRRPRTARPP